MGRIFTGKSPVELFSARPQSLSDSTRLTPVARAAFIFLTSSQSDGQRYTADFTGRLGGSNEAEKMRLGLQFAAR